MNNKQSKKIISIRTRLFLQVGAVVVVAVLLILSLNNFLLPTIYAKNEKRSLIDVKNEISTFDVNAGDYVSQLIRFISVRRTFSRQRVKLPFQSGRTMTTAHFLKFRRLKTKIYSI